MVKLMKEEQNVRTFNGSTFKEPVAMFIVTFILSLLFYKFIVVFVPENYARIAAVGSHLPMLIIPWLWIRFRMRSNMEKLVLWKWTEKSIKPLLLIAAWLLPLQIIGNLDVIGNPLPIWYQHGAGTILLELFFQGIFVGFAEEMLMRPAIHRTLLVKSGGGFYLFRKVYISFPLIITSSLFAVLHMVNFMNQPIGLTVFQALYAFIIGTILGYYYERTRNYIGTALLHNAIDVIHVVVVLLVAWML
ncbi:CPBP family intramembrane glutamic endopeptidase [Lentibacillus sp. N15]|uniref:CPBP family intramembrane glutamic endopeptidase n=1 Tax=Lentibacillus songyuanensis TaxID=3136161 RepID=UPI0031BB0FBC